MKWIHHITVAMACGMASADPPKFDALFPAGGQAGSGFVVEIAGKVEEGCRWWTDAPGVEFEPTEDPKVWKFSIAEDTPAGLYQILLYNSEGAAPARWFSVGKLPEIAEEEVNDEVGEGQQIDSMPLCVNGRFDKAGDVDGYRIPLREGETLIAMVEAYVLGSPVDVLAHMINPRGERVATFSDGRNLDPFIAFTAPTEGTYTLQLAGFAHPPAANVEFAGGEALVYRLHLSTGPVVTGFHPAVLIADRTMEVELLGYNLEDGMRRHFPLPPPQVGAPGELVAVDLPHALAPIHAVFHEGPDAGSGKGTMERDVTGGVLTGENRHEVEMKKGDRLEARVRAHSMGLPLDATLRIKDPEGKVLATVDDHDGQPDPVAQWTAAADGTFEILVSDTLGRKAKTFHYVLEVGEPVPLVKASFADAKPLVVENGGSIKLKINVKRANGHTEPVKIRIEGLPEGVSFAEMEVPEKGGDVEVELATDDDAGVFNGLIGAVVVDGNGTPAGRVTASLRGDLARGTSLLDSTDGIWLTVKRKP